MTDVVDVDGLTSGWLAQALDRDVQLSSCERIGTGQTAAAYRLTLVADTEPTTLVAKVAHGDEASRARVAEGFRCEVGFYDALLATVDVRAPHSYYAAISDDASRFTLLLEDLAPRVPGVQTDGCTTAQADAAVRNLAGLHAPRWNDPTLFEHSFVRNVTPDGAAFLGDITESAAGVFVERYGSDLGDADVESLRACAAATGQWILTRPDPFALLHGDYRLDNLMFGDTDVVGVDWQTLAAGPAARDLAYFLGTSVSVEQRRTEEEHVVRVYHDELLARGISDYSVERCFDDYRLGQLQGPMITMIGAVYATAGRSTQADAMFLAMARRSCAAIRDLGSLDLVSAV